MNGNDFFQNMCREARDEMASGEKGWKEADTNTLLLACFGQLTNHMTHKITRPLWFFASAVMVGVIAFIVNSIMGG